MYCIFVSLIKSKRNEYDLLFTALFICPCGFGSITKGKDTSYY
jgi:hypothetical protein